MPEHAGRPSGDSQIRQQLLHHARLLFSKKGYAKVSTRLIADAAGVNAAMIRYYFQDKAGLFEAVVTETIQPLARLVRQQNQQKSQSSPALFIQTYYQLMGQAPELPKLIFRSLHDPDSAEHRIVSKIFGQMFQQMISQLQRYMREPGRLKPECDPLNAIVSCVSLAIFPFLMPDVVKQQLGIAMTPEFLTQLGQHQQQLLHSGLVPDQEKQNV
ncbi:TetR/AcrR family transcriptional regulator [Rheinheimera sp.]|uniref:TetR/AcrR family transcriptional regulator n=1 Tax=Rheinheimera sp. TaxID=1869214 RepID=UPI00307EB4CE